MPSLAEGTRTCLVLLTAQCRVSLTSGNGAGARGQQPAVVRGPLRTPGLFALSGSAPAVLVRPVLEVTEMTDLACAVQATLARFATFECCAAYWTQSRSTPTLRPPQQARSTDLQNGD